MLESANGEGCPSGGQGFRLTRGGRLLGPLFGLVFQIYPVRAVLTSEPAPTRVALALGGAALFAGEFLWLMWTQEPLRSPSAEASDVQRHRAAVTSLALLAISLNLALGSEWRVLFFHLNVAAGLMLLTIDAYVAIAVLEREREVLATSEGTVRNYLSTAIKKLGTRNRIEAARLAEERGWL